MLDRLIPIYVGLTNAEQPALLVALTEGIAPRSIERLIELASSQADMWFAESGMSEDIPVTCDDICPYLGKAMSKQYAQNVRYEEKMSVLPPSIAAAFEGL